MKLSATLGGAVCIACAAAAHDAQAGGIELTPQSINVIYEDGNYAEVGFQHLFFSANGTDIVGNRTGNIANDITLGFFNVKFDVTEKLAFALAVDQPFGIDTRYAVGASILGGTTADVDTIAYTGVLRYKITENWSVHGGVRAQTIKADARLGGAAFGPVNGYGVSLRSETSFGYVVGGAFEIPELALRVALNYNSAVSYDGRLTETLPAFLGGGSATNIAPFRLPQSVNLDFQTGVSPTTLVFGQVRWVDWTDFSINPAVFSGTLNTPLADFPKDVLTYTLGAAHQLNENWSVFGVLAYEDERVTLASPLGPSDGYYLAGLGAQYDTDTYRISIAASHLWIRPSTAQGAFGAAANFGDTTAVALDVRVGYKF